MISALKIERLVWNTLLHFGLVCKQVFDYAERYLEDDLESMVLILHMDNQPVHGPGSLHSPEGLKASYFTENIARFMGVNVEVIRSRSIFHTVGLYWSLSASCCIPAA